MIITLTLPLNPPGPTDRRKTHYAHSRFSDSVLCGVGRSKGRYIKWTEIPSRVTCKRCLEYLRKGSDNDQQ